MTGTRTHSRVLYSQNGLNVKNSRIVFFAPRIQHVGVCCVRRCGSLGRLMSLSLGTPPPLTQHTAAEHPAAPTHECTGPASTGPRRTATEEKGRVSRTATGQRDSAAPRVPRSVATQALSRAYPYGIYSAYNLATPWVPLRGHTGTRPSLPLWYLFSLQPCYTLGAAPWPHRRSAGPTPMVFIQLTTLLHPGCRSVATQALGRAYPCGIYSAYNLATPWVPLRGHTGARPGLPLWYLFSLQFRYT